VVLFSIHLSKFWGRKKFFGKLEKFSTFTKILKIMKIPGLIANKKEDSKLTSAELQAKRDSFEAYMKSWKPEEELTTNSIKSNTAHLMNQYNTGIDPYKNEFINTQNIPFNQPMWEYIPPQNPNPGPFGGLVKSSPNRKDVYQTQDMVRYLQEALAPKKSDFELLLNSMFDTSEKEQFLITLGFEFTHENGEDYISRTVAGLLEKGKKAVLFDKIFLREMTIKFKNLLISKNSLKMKLG